MDAFPTYSSLVMTVTTMAFLVCYAIATGVHVLRSIRNRAPLHLTSIVVALWMAFSGSVLSLFALWIAFRSS